MDNWKKMWALLDAQERRNAFKVLAVMIVAALASAAMVGSVFPFLSVLSDTGLIQRNSILSWLYEAGGFQSSYQFVVALGTATVSVILVANLILILQTWAIARFNQMRIHSISKRLLSHYLAQPYEYFLGQNSGKLSANILSESQQVVFQFLTPLAIMISSSLTISAVVVLLLFANPLAASMTIGVFGSAYTIILLAARGHVKKLGEFRAQRNEARFRIAGESLSGIKDIKLLGREHSYLDRYSEQSVQMARIIARVDVLGEVPRFAIQIIAFGAIVLLCLFLLDPKKLESGEALGGVLPFVGLLAFAAMRIMPELQKVYRAGIQMTDGAAALNRIYDDIAQGEQRQIPRARPIPFEMKATLELDCVNYSYPGAELASLHDISLTIRAGERIGIVGASGSGKTTLADVVLGLLVPQSGTIRVDGTEITPAIIRAWQQFVGYVPQDIFLADATLAENIALGTPLDEVDRDWVEAAGRTARIHDLVSNQLPDGYETPIGERGVRLSGGQRQRIGIARALYHNAGLIVFDEATSALDNVTEHEVMASIDSLPGSKTVVIIAHRLSTVRTCDRIVFMKSGQVEHYGTWDDLMRYSVDFRAMASDTKAS